MTSMLRMLKYFRYPKALSGHVIVSKQNRILHSPVNICTMGCSKRYIETQPDVFRTNDMVISEKVTLLNRMIQRERWITPGQINYISENVYSINDIDSSQALSVLRCCEIGLIGYPESEIVKVVQSFWDVLSSYNIPMDVYHYNALLKIYLKHNHEFHPPTILKEMVAKGIKPNVITYECFISYFSQKGDISETLKTLEHLKSYRAPVTTKILNSVVRAYMKIDDVKEALNIVDMMKNANMELTGETYTILMCNYAKDNSVEEIINTIASCAKRNIFLSNKDILEVIYALAFNNHLESIDKITPFLDKTNCPNEDMSLIIKFVDIGYVDIALDLLHKIFLNVLSSEEYIKRIFIPKLASSNLTVEKIADISQKLETDFNLKKPIFSFLQYALLRGNEEFSLKILKFLKSMQYPIREHYFWPILAAKSRVHDVNGIMNTVNVIITEFNITPSLYTISYLSPKGLSDLELICSWLRKYNISSGILNNFVVLKLLENNATDAAVEYINTHADYYSYALLHPLLTKKLLIDKNVNNYIYITKNLYDEVASECLSEMNKNGGKLVVPVSTNKVLCDLMQALNTDKGLFVKVLHTLPMKKQCLTKETFIQICKYLEAYKARSLVKKLNSMIFEVSNNILMILNFATKNTTNYCMDIDLLELELISSIQKCLQENQHVSDMIHMKLERKYKDQGNIIIPPRDEILIQLISYFIAKCDYDSTKTCFDALHKDYPDRVVKSDEYLKHFTNSVNSNKPFAFQFVNTVNHTPMKRDETECGEFMERIKQIGNTELSSACTHILEKQSDPVKQQHSKQINLKEALESFLSAPYTNQKNRAAYLRFLVISIARAKEYTLFQKLINHYSVDEQSSDVFVHILITCLKWKFTDSFMFFAQNYSKPVSIAFKYELLDAMCTVAKLNRKFLRTIFYLTPSSLFDINDKSLLCEKIANTYENDEKEKALHLQQSMRLHSVPLSKQLEKRLNSIIDGHKDNIEFDLHKPEVTKKDENKNDEEVLERSNSELAANVR